MNFTMLLLVVAFLIRIRFPKGTPISTTTVVCNYDIDTGMVAKDAHESENNKSCKLCDKRFIETTILDIYICKFNDHPRPQEQQEEEEQEEKRE